MLGTIVLFYHKLVCNQRKLSSTYAVLGSPKMYLLGGDKIPLFYHKLPCNERKLSSVYAVLGFPKMYLLGGDNTSLLPQT